MYECCLELAAAGLLQSAHDCSDGGLAVALAECCVSSGAWVGAEIEMANPRGLREDALLFGESQSRIVVSVGADRVARVIEIAARWGVPVARVGRTGGDRLQIVIEGRVVVDVAVADAAKAWSEGLPTLLKGSTCAPT